MKNALKSLLLLSLLALSHLAFADDSSLTKVLTKKELSVGFCAAYPPFESRNAKTGEFEGFDIDLGRAIAEKLGVTVKLNDAEWQGLIPSLNKGDFDVLITGMLRTPKREESVDFTDAYYQLRDIFVVRKENTSIKSAADLKDKVIGVQLGTASEEKAIKAEQRYQFAELRRFNYNPEAFLDLEHGRIDAVIVGLPYAINALKAAPDLRIVANIDDEVSDISIVTKKGEQALNHKINEILSQMKQSGELQRLEQKWFSVSGDHK